MDKSNKIALVLGLGTVAAVTTAVGISSYKANQQGTETAEGPASEPIVRTERINGTPWSCYNEAEHFSRDAGNMIGSMHPTMTREDRAEAWGEIADAQERALNAYTDAIRTNPRSSYAKLAQLRIDSLYIDPVFQEADAGDIIHAGKYTFEVRKKRKGTPHRSAALTLNLYIDGELAGKGYLETSPKDWTVREVTEHMTK